MSKIKCERGKTMLYPNLYPKLLVTPVFAHEGDFMWVEKIVCMYDADLDDVEEPEFEFHRDTAHYEKNERLQAENTKLRRLLSEAFQMMHRGGLTTGAYGRCMELFRDAQALGIEIPFMNELEDEVNE
jgi:hypothetical protein